MERIVDAGLYAASGRGLQSPVILIVIAEKTASTYVYDGSVALGNMMLKAKELRAWREKTSSSFVLEL